LVSISFGRLCIMSDLSATSFLSVLSLNTLRSLPRIS
jgi:hypothetical protein